MPNDLITAQKNEIVIYQPNETLRLEVKLEDETVWLTQSQMTDGWEMLRDRVYGKPRVVIWRRKK